MISTLFNPFSVDGGYTQTRMAAIQLMHVLPAKHSDMCLLRNIVAAFRGMHVSPAKHRWA